MKDKNWIYKEEELYGLRGGGIEDYTVKKVSDFPVPGMSLAKLSLAGNYLIIPGQGEFG